jgi:transposase
MLETIMATVKRERERAFEVAHPNAAGIDIGAKSHFVAVPADRDEVTVREFTSFTDDLQCLAQWLRQCEVDIVAMESTGVYWIPLYELLSSQGFEVHRVNARHVKNVSGRKSDVLDCQWLQQLMSYGLLSGAFRPDDAICHLRALSRQRDMLTHYQSRHVPHMQKALTQMNVPLHNVISDLTGETGMRIVRAILKSEREGEKRASLRHARIRACREDIVRSLRGPWREEHLFALHQAVTLYDTYAKLLDECDQAISEQLDALSRMAVSEDTSSPKKRGRPRHSAHEKLRQALCCALGVDRTQIAGIDTGTALKVLSEVGFDLSRFKSAKHFASWLGLCPGTKISGGKILSGASKRTSNRLAQALRMAAMALRRSSTALGAYHRRMLARLDKAKAMTATAHKLARLIYTLLTKGAEYVDQGQAYYENGTSSESSITCNSGRHRWAIPLCRTYRLRKTVIENKGVIFVS